MSQYTYTINMVDISGPLPLFDIASMFQNAQLPPSTLVCEVGKKGWWPIDAVLQEKGFMSPPTPSPSIPSTTSITTATSSTGSTAISAEPAMDAVTNTTSSEPGSIRRRLEIDQPLVPPINEITQVSANPVSPSSSIEGGSQISSNTESPAEAAMPTRPRRRLSLGKVIATTQNLSLENANVSSSIPVSSPAIQPSQPTQSVFTPVQPMQQAQQTQPLPTPIQPMQPAQQPVQQVAQSASITAQSMEPMEQNLPTSVAVQPMQSLQPIQSAQTQIHEPAIAFPSQESTRTLPQSQSVPSQGTGEIDSTEPYQVIEQIEGRQNRVRLLKYHRLQGREDLTLLEKLDLIQKQSLSPFQVCIELQDSSFIAAPGVLHFFKGSVQMRSTNVENQVGSLSHVGYHGRGEVYLEPVLGHMALLHLNEDTMIVERNMFYAADGEVRVAHFQPEEIMGGPSHAYLRLQGSGWVALKLPVAMSEILRFTLKGEKLSIDGNDAILRRGAITLKLEMPGSTASDFSRSQEGILQTFEGSGEIWIAPMQKIYQKLF